MVAAPDTTIVGHTLPRIFTPPLVEGPPGPCGCGCALTPATSYGFDVINFARRFLGVELDPWQRWLVIHAGELLPDGRPRARQLVVLVARQNGKTMLLRILTLFWLHVERHECVLGMSTKLGTARKTWAKTVKMARDTPLLERKIRNVREANGQEEYLTTDDCVYEIAAANRKGGRGDTLSRIVMDELREQHTYESYDAAKPAIMAVPNAQLWCITNQGDDRSLVLNDLRDQAMEGADPRLCVFEWSSPDDMAPDDPEALAMANPSIGLGRIQMDDLIGDARRAMAAGGEQLAGFLTEHHCRRVALLNPAIDPSMWELCVGNNSLDDFRDDVAMCFDVSWDEQHASLYAAAVDGESVRVDEVRAWEGQQAVAAMRSELPGLIDGLRPKMLGWFPYGPSAVAAADMAERKGWPPRRVTVEPIRGNLPAVCMGFAEQVRSRAIVRGDDPLLDAHVRAAEKKSQGDGWTFTRKGAGQVDAVYAAAGAVHLARTAPRKKTPNVRSLTW